MPPFRMYLHAGIALLLYSANIASGDSLTSEERARVRLAAAARYSTEPAGLRYLDSLGIHYVLNDDAVHFDTQYGRLWFEPHDIHVGTLDALPLGNDVAWVRIGKTNSDDSEKMIQDWAAHMALPFLKDGYAQVERKIEPTRYGGYTSLTWEKSDMYCRIYFERSRVQGTYNSTFTVCTYFFEVGSKQRKSACESQQYGGPR